MPNSTANKSRPTKGKKKQGSKGRATPTKGGRTSDASVAGGEVQLSKSAAKEVKDSGRSTSGKARHKGTKRTGPSSGSAQGGKAKQKAPKYTAKTADVHELYQLAVQSPDVDAAFVARLFKRLRNRPARHLREDFCGTGFYCAEWLRRHRENTAEGFDIDDSTIEWGLERNFEGLENVDGRATLHVADVREPSQRTPDLRVAPNFSWQIFMERGELLEYFTAVRQDLASDGVFVLDIYGGPEAFEEMEEERKIPAGFTYVWDQDAYYPATGHYRCKIHFRFKDGSAIENAFDYTWRLWNLPEVVDILKDAGFSQVDSYWEGTDEDGESGNGVFRKSKKGENCPAWVTYIIALP